MRANAELRSDCARVKLRCTNASVARGTRARSVAAVELSAAVGWVPLRDRMAGDVLVDARMVVAVGIAAVERQQYLVGVMGTVRTRASGSGPSEGPGLGDFTWEGSENSDGQAAYCCRMESPRVNTTTAHEQSPTTRLGPDKLT